MSNFKGTKGGWALYRFSEGQMSVRNKDNTRKICVSRVNNAEESEANMLLISKSPQMLVMLEEWVSLLDGTPELKLWVEKTKSLIKEATEL